jgi:hypothetical protein
MRPGSKHNSSSCHGFNLPGRIFQAQKEREIKRIGRVWQQAQCDKHLTIHILPLLFTFAMIVFIKVIEIL